MNYDKDYLKTYGNYLQHHGVLGMKWGKRKAVMSERANLRKAAYAITDKRKDEFLKVAEKRRKQVEEYDAQTRNMKNKKIKDIDPKKISNGKKIAIAATTAIGGMILADELFNREQNKTIRQFIGEFIRA